MPLPIQRVPRWLGQLLTTFGGETPQRLADDVVGHIDLLQFYGSQQVSNANGTDAALAEGGNITLTVPNTQHWVLFAVQGNIARTATMTALRATIQAGDANSLGFLCTDESTIFGATVAGSWRFGLWLPYPRVLPPGGIVRLNLDVLGTDATASALLSAYIGVLG